MTNVVPFPLSRRARASSIPREEFERLAELALDVVDRIVALLNETDGDADLELDADGEPSLGAPEHQISQIGWFRGGSRELEIP